MDLLYLGSVTNVEELKTLSGASVAGNNMQLNIIKNLYRYEDINIKVFATKSLAPFPKERTIVVKKAEIELIKGLTATQVPFINIPVIKQISQAISLFWYAKKEINNNSIVMSFNLFFQEGIALRMLKKNCGAENLALLADLPIDSTYNRRGISKVLRKLFNKITENNIKNCANLIVLNKNAISKYAPDANYVVIEGGIDEAFIPEKYSEYITKERRNLIYSGALTEYSGINNLIEAMAKINDKTIVLDIYGGGEQEAYVKQKSNELKNVNYFGTCENKMIRELQKEAYLLVNPRPVDDPISQVSFPSKIFEYMISGTATLTTKLNGFSADYMDLMFFTSTNDPVELADKIEEIMNMDSIFLQNKAIKAADYIKKNKTWNKQSQIIYDFIKKIP